MFEFNESLEQARRRNVENALTEDIGTQDWTAQLIPSNQRVIAQVVVKQANAILCGQEWFNDCIKFLDPSANINWLYRDGDEMLSQSPICEINANARALLSAERPALNFLQLLSWTATTTSHHVHAIADIHANPKGCSILDTRKTIPGLRQAQKYAVRVGGGKNQRIALWDGILIKENHIVAAGSISAALKSAQELHSSVEIQIEVESISELKEAIAAGAKSILIDDFTLDEMKLAVEIAQFEVLLEVSGGVELNQLRAIAMTGVDRISIGKLTKDVLAIDYSMRVLQRIEL
ncbi:MAG: carboxylating nicotinate-nucleotide diphosphorylase [Betaproteobacteria bacterium]|jgi:nicotinate-nucleotide pyrophosphorylase (carboxylating)